MSVNPAGKTLKAVSLKTPVFRSCFDEEINDFIELVHLWVNSGAGSRLLSRYILFGHGGVLSNNLSRSSMPPMEDYRH